MYFFMPGDKRIHCHQMARKIGLDMPFTVFRAEFLQKPDLLFRKLNLRIPVMFLKPHEPLMPSLKFVS